MAVLLAALAAHSIPCSDPRQKAYQKSNQKSIYHTRVWLCVCVSAVQVYNKAAARVQYSGELLALGKAVGDAAAGGMILLSESSYKCVTRRTTTVYRTTELLNRAV